MATPLHSMRGPLSASLSGICQGNGAGPATQLALSLWLIHMIYWFGPHSYYQWYLPHSVALVGFTYMDDCDLLHCLPLLTLTPIWFSLPYKPIWTCVKVASMPLENLFPMINAPGVNYFIILRPVFGSFISPNPFQSLLLLSLVIPPFLSKIVNLMRHFVVVGVHKA